eukprot:4108646-Prymnesium_polylepis.1
MIGFGTFTAFVIRGRMGFRHFPATTARSSVRPLPCHQGPEVRAQPHPQALSCNRSSSTSFKLSTPPRRLVAASST